VTDRDPPLTQMLAAAADGDSAAADELLPKLYDQLRAIAQQRRMFERPDHTLQATELVHEAYLRLVGEEKVDWRGRAQFFAAAAEAMRRILIEHARARARIKRGGDGQHAAKRHPLEVGNVAELAVEQSPESLLELDDAMTRLAAEDERLGQVMRLRVYAGLTIEETASALDVSPRTVKRDWAYVRAWLYRELADDDPAVEPADDPADEEAE